MNRQGSMISTGMSPRSASPELAGEWICHRVNTAAELETLPREFGVEVDLRDQAGELILSHDPFSLGEPFEDYLKFYAHGTMILNIKSERIEERVLSLLRRYDIRQYFFLDSSFPMIVQLSRQGERRIALRYSEYEGLDTLRNMAGKVEWVWVDCFTRFPLDTSTALELRAMGYKLCLVSPELQGRPEDIRFFREMCLRNSIRFDAICTKMRFLKDWFTAVSNNAL